MTTLSPVGSAASDASQRRKKRSPDSRAEFERLQPYEEVARQVIRLRLDHALSQEALARRVGTTKSAISRLESGQHAPNLSTLGRIADAFDGRVVVSFDIPPAPRGAAEAAS